MQERKTIHGANAAGHKMVHVPFHKAVNLEPNAFVVSSYGRRGYFRRNVIHFRAAIFGLKYVGPTLQGIAVRIAGGLRIDLVGESQLEAVGFSAHFMNFERHFSGPLYTI